MSYSDAYGFQSYPYSYSQHATYYDPSPYQPQFEQLFRTQFQAPYQAHYSGFNAGSPAAFGVPRSHVLEQAVLWNLTAGTKGTPATEAQARRFPQHERFVYDQATSSYVQPPVLPWIPTFQPQPNDGQAAGIWSDATPQYNGFDGWPTAPQAEWDRPGAQPYAAQSTLWQGQPPGGESTYGPPGAQPVGWQNTNWLYQPEVQTYGLQPTQYQTGYGLPESQAADQPTIEAVTRNAIFGAANAASMPFYGSQAPATQFLPNPLSGSTQAPVAPVQEQPLRSILRRFPGDNPNRRTEQMLPQIGQPVAASGRSIGGGEQVRGEPPVIYTPVMTREEIRALELIDPITPPRPPPRGLYSRPASAFPTVQAGSTPILPGNPTRPRVAQQLGHVRTMIARYEQQIGRQR
jgi:hypothetical protein